MKKTESFDPSDRQVECAKIMIRDLLEKHGGYIGLCRPSDAGTLRALVFKPFQLDREPARQEHILKVALEALYEVGSVKYDASLCQLGWTGSLGRKRKPSSSSRYEERKAKRWQKSA